MFWKVKQDTHNELVTSAIRRNKFLEIHKYLHTCDNLQLSENHKFAKLEHCKLLNKAFLENFEKFIQ